MHRENAEIHKEKDSECLRDSSVWLCVRNVSLLP
jgi:hypothetical protein